MGVGENLDNAKQKVEELKMSFRDYQNVLKGINEGLGVKNDKVKDATKEYTALIGIARQFAAVEEGILDLSDQQLQKDYHLDNPSSYRLSNKLSRLLSFF